MTCILLGTPNNSKSTSLNSYWLILILFHLAVNAKVCGVLSPAFYCVPYVDYPNYIRNPITKISYFSGMEVKLCKFHITCFSQ